MPRLRLLEKLLVIIFLALAAITTVVAKDVLFGANGVFANPNECAPGQQKKDGCKWVQHTVTGKCQWLPDHAVAPPWQEVPENTCPALVIPTEQPSATWVPTDVPTKAPTSVVTTVVKTQAPTDPATTVYPPTATVFSPTATCTPTVAPAKASDPCDQCTLWEKFLALFGKFVDSVDKVGNAQATQAAVESTRIIRETRP